MTPIIQDPQELAKRLGCQILGRGHAVPVVDLTADSRKVTPGLLFAAMPGERHHGVDFINKAYINGARVIMTDAFGAVRAIKEHPDLCIIQSNDPRMTLAQMAALFYPDAPKYIVAITGTNGKTSTASFVRQIWQGLGKTAVNFGTAGVEGAVEENTKHTTPEPIALHRLLSVLAHEGVTHAAMEASSHGLDQNRLDGVSLSAAGFTNLTRDHLDYHPSFGDYFAAKAGLFDRVLPRMGTAVINMDDPFGDTLRLVAEGRGQNVITTGKGERVDLRLVDQRFREDGQDIRVRFRNQTAMARLNLIGDFQSENLLVAMGLVLSEPDIAFGDVMDTLAGLTTVRGRMQLAARRDNGAAVFVDYAHTPDALKTALSALRPHVMGRLIVVIGAGGDRDPGKRPMMGQAAQENADLVFVTDDNPRSEEPAIIREAVMQGAPDATEIADRAEAILRAIDAALDGDVVLIAGKGHETGQEVDGHILPFDDVEQASISVAALEGREI